MHAYTLKKPTPFRFIPNISILFTGKTTHLKWILCNHTRQPLITSPKSQPSSMNSKIHIHSNRHFENFLEHVLPVNNSILKLSNKLKMSESFNPDNDI